MVLTSGVGTRDLTVSVYEVSEMAVDQTSKEIVPNRLIMSQSLNAVNKTGRRVLIG